MSKKGLFEKVACFFIGEEGLEHKRKVNRLKAEIKNEAELEALKESKDTFKEQFKAKQQKKSVPFEEKMKKFAKAMGVEEGANTQDKLDRMLGTKSSSSKSDEKDDSKVLSNDKIKEMLGR